MRLRDIVDQKKMRGRFRLEGVDKGELAMDLQWLGVLDHQYAPLK